MEGGPSHIDLFDPSSSTSLQDKATHSFDRPVTAMGEVNSPLLASKERKQHGQGGLWISDWLPNHANIADELCPTKLRIRWNQPCWWSRLMNMDRSRRSPLPWCMGHLRVGNRKPKLPGFVVLKDSKSAIVNGVAVGGQASCLQDIKAYWNLRRTNRQSTTHQWS